MSNVPSPARPSAPSVTVAAAAQRGAASGPVHVRRLHPGEEPLLLAHLKRLDPEIRRLRFGNAVNDFFLERYVSLALGEEALVKGLFIDGELRGAAELRFLTGSHDEAEGAFSIEKPYQGHGHGDRLFGRLVASARNRGVRRLFLTCLRENRRMQAIAAKHGADLSFEAGDVTAEILRPYADVRSMAREWTDETEAFAFAMIEWRRKRLRSFAAPLRRLAASFNPFPAPH
ncbi:GNAT family N-acetyltransferase [Aurantimonas sp. DM33-3]|uniref:GNAT family N-acetyltransferase n=1 Tax=Aurantimonas sp. DM33-3 TaxID=2766955 RepID=UPI0016520E93|nr:GNAT family N-acetyltransferase [Aurantimonas sp. DM33-3]MBC6717417.1 GNAT family N-acetyltransferase [Aurantimonas sp. DM33-3]